MNKYTFIRTEDKDLSYLLRSVQVIHNGKNIGQLPLSDRMKRGITVQKLRRWISNETSINRLIALGTPVEVELDSEITF